MTPEQIKLVKDSFKEVLPIAGVAADLFYDRLFEIAPEVRPLFRDDLVAQKKKLMAMLATVVANLHELDKIAPAVGDLGNRHVAYGVTAKHFEPVGAALLWTLGEILGADFAPPVKTAWTEAYVTLAGVMSGAAANGTRTLRTAEAELEYLRARLAALEGPPSMPFSA